MDVARLVDPELEASDVDSMTEVSTFECDISATDNEYCDRVEVDDWVDDDEVIAEELDLSQLRLVDAAIEATTTNMARTC